jgi:hypothetical protein
MSLSFGLSLAHSKLFGDDHNFCGGKRFAIFPASFAGMGLGFSI